MFCAMQCNEASPPRMKLHSPWVIFIFPMVAAFPENENKTPQRFENGSLPLVLPKRTTLDEILKAYNIHYLENQVPSRIKRSSCPIDKQLLTKLAGLIKKMRNYVPQQNHTTTAVIGQPSPSSGTPCDVAKTHLSDNLLALVKVFQIMLINGTMLKEDDFNKLKQHYDDLVRKFEEDFKIIRETDDADVRAGVEEVLHEKRLLEARLDTIVGSIQFNITTQKKARENQILAIVYGIAAGEYDSAIKMFRKLGDHNVTMHEIVDKMKYSEKHNEALLSFIKELPGLPHRLMGYGAMLNKNQFHYSIITLEYDFNDLLSRTNAGKVVSEVKGTMDFIETKTKELVAEKISEMVLVIVRRTPEDYEKMIEYSKRRMKAFRAHLEELVERVYGQPNDTTGQIFAFANELRDINQKAMVYLKLNRILERERDQTHPHLLKIALKVKQLLSKNYIYILDDIKVSMKELKEKMPQSIRSIIWGRVCIKNRKFGGFLHHHGNPEESVVLRGSPGDIWEFETGPTSEFFMIRHAGSNLFLESEEDRIFAKSLNDRNYRKVWALEDYTIKDGEFYIKNLAINMYLNAEKLDKGVGNSFPITSADLDESSKWVIVDSKFC